MNLSKYTPDELNKARNIDLYEFLLAKCPDRVIRRGDSLRWKDNKSISIREGYKGCL